MNIFATDKCPIKSAQNMCDTHVVKMVLESAQLLCSYLNEQGIETPYKSTHLKHPCSLWLKEIALNRSWLFEHYYALIQEYRFRYGKRHKCNDLLGLFYFNFYFEDAIEILNNSNLKFALAMPDEYKTDCPFQSYKNYYISKKHSMKREMKWTNRQPPEWFKFEEKERIK